MNTTKSSVQDKVRDYYGETRQSSADLHTSVYCSAAPMVATRYAEHFRIDGGKQHHFGLFECAPTAVNNDSAERPCC